VRISKLVVDGFGLFDGRFELQVPAGVALILGDNETGKSTLVAAVGAILFGFKGEAERALYAPRSGGPLSGGPLSGGPLSGGPRSGTLEVETRGARYRFTREFKTNHVKIELLGESEQIVFQGSAKPSGRTDEKEKYDEWMRKLFGLGSRELFCNSAFVLQDSLAAEMGDVARQIASGSPSSDYAVVEENLKEACAALTVAVPWGRSASRKPREIENIESAIREKKDVLERSRRTEQTLDDLRNRLNTVESELDKTAKSVAEQEEWEKALASFAAEMERKKRVEEELNRCRKERDEVQRLTDEVREITETIEGKYSEYAAIPEQADGEIGEMARLKETENNLQERMRSQEPVDVWAIARRRFPAIAIVVGLLLAGYGAVSLEGTLRILVIIVGLLIAVWPLISILIALRSHEMARKARLEELGKELEAVKKQSAEIIRRYPLLERREPEEVLSNLRELRRLRAEKEKREELLRYHGSQQEIESKYDSLSNDLIVVSKALESLKGERPRLNDIETGQIGKALEDARGEIAGLGRKRDELTRERDELRYKLATAEASQTFSEEALEEEIAEMDAELERLKLTREAYLIAIKLLDEAISEFRASHLERIEQKTSVYLEQITGEKCRVQLDENLKPLGIEREQQFLRLEQLSQGTRDQLYFVLRLAAVEEVCGEVRLPILLDDPFVNFDADRLQATLHMLDAVSNSHQIVLLAHDRRYADWRKPAHVLKR